MRQKVSYISVPDGFKMEIKEEKISLEEAENILTTRQKRNISTAKRDGDMVTLIRHRLICPYCRNRTPAYYRFVGKRVPLHRREILEWVSDHSPIASMGTPLILNNVFSPQLRFFCQFCKKESKPFTQNKDVAITTAKKKIMVSLTYDTIRDFILSDEEVVVGLSGLKFPVTETLTFNLGNGHVHYTIHGADGTLAMANDIRSAKEFSADSVLCQTINSYDLVRRRIAKEFKGLYGTELPYLKRELSLETFLKMTMFVGYSRLFIDHGIPFDIKSGRVDQSFKKLTKWIHNAEKLPQLYDRNALPQSKAVRRIFFEQPGFFFYVKEAEYMWQLLEDVNYYRRFLELSHSFDILSFLHDYPTATVFLNEFKALRETGILFCHLQKNWREMKSYSLAFCAMSQRRKKAETEKWLKHWKPEMPNADYSFPMGGTSSEIRECELNGYEFVWLKSRTDYIQAAEELNNCLADWNMPNSSIMVMKKDGCCRAAIELSNGVIHQAFARNNDPIEDDEELKKAYTDWKTLYMIPQIDDMIVFERVVNDND